MSRLFRSVLGNIGLIRFCLLFLCNSLDLAWGSIVKHAKIEPDQYFPTDGPLAGTITDISNLGSLEDEILFYFEMPSISGVVKFAYVITSLTRSKVVRDTVIIIVTFQLTDVFI